MLLSSLGWRNAIMAICMDPAFRIIMKFCIYVLNHEPLQISITRTILKVVSMTIQKGHHRHVQDSPSVRDLLSFGPDREFSSPSVRSIQ